MISLFIQKKLCEFNVKKILKNSSPWRIVEDCGAAFAMGTVGGSIFHAFKGFRNAPQGYKHRFNGAFITVRQKATLTGAGFAAWGGMFSVVDCSLAHIRKKEDAWNSVGSGFITGGLLQIRRGIFIFSF